jgi:hypothetical protein
MKVKVGEDCLHKRVSLQPGDQAAQAKKWYSNLVRLMKVKVGEDCLHKRVSLQPGDQAAQALVHYPNHKLWIEAEQKDRKMCYVF